MIGYQVERLIRFGLSGGLIGEWDVIPVRNALLDLLGLNEPYEGEVKGFSDKSAGPALDAIVDHCVETGQIPEDTITRRDLFAARIMGLLTPRQSEVIAQFRENYSRSPKAATDAFYALSHATNYIQAERIAKNLRWSGQTDFGRLDITVNLAKPEKDPKEIAAAKATAQTNYPKCLICAENAGFAGTLSHPARQNHRIIPLTLDGERWYMQYSPYLYYDEHCIVLDEIHRPMKIGRQTFRRLLAFVEQFPHYFLGSNADLPIVGGSILTHDHFQGGRFAFPMVDAPVRRSFTHRDFPGITAAQIHWPLSTIRISGEDKDALTALAQHIFTGWQQYADPAAEILAFSGKTPHNTITPIARKNNGGRFDLDIVLRNNRTTPERPHGLFHPGERLHHIKKENIGLIEVMGLAILPGRLLAELDGIRDILSGKQTFDRAEIRDPVHPLNKHLHWLDGLTEKHGTGLDPDRAQTLLRGEVAQIFAQALVDCGVFKLNKDGDMQFERLMAALGFMEA
ncbi:MAG: UDP-glucose--hexose-1-phosphate uridylyltransferase [Oscillospiraceae bacterium]|nr:UDP-glucose--hexose-1-phosphate uridylyltransferase [Oscillospiraceae bacterium]